MNRRRYLPMLAALALCALLISACGSSSSSSTTASSSTPAATQSTPATTSSTTTTTTTSTTPSTGASGSSNVRAATEECKQIIQSQTKLPEGAKKKLEGACEKAAKGDTSAVKTAAREVCEEVVNTSAVPSGAAKEAALASCKK